MTLIKPDLSKDTTGKTAFILWCADEDAYVYSPEHLDVARLHFDDPLFNAVALLQLEVDEAGVPIAGSVVKHVEAERG